LRYPDAGPGGGIRERLSGSRGEISHDSSEAEREFVGGVGASARAARPAGAARRNLVIGLFRLSGVRNIAAARRTHAWHAQRAIALVTAPQGITQ